VKWYKQDGNSDSNPKIRRAGYWGARTYEALCRISADFELGGKIPAHYADPSYLADRTMAIQILPPDEAEAAIAAGLERLGTKDPKWALVELHEDGSLTILGWRGEGQDTDALSSTERSRNFRALQDARKEIERLTALIGDLHPGPQRDATPGNAAATPATPATLATNATFATTEERRGEERREDLPPPTPSAAAPGGTSPPGPPGGNAGGSGRKRRPPDATSVRALMAAWNERAHPSMPRAEEPPKLSGPMKAELRERPLEGPGGWLELIERMNRSAWCRGDAPSSTRASDLSFLLRNAADVRNGKFDDRGHRRQPPRLVGGLAPPPPEPIPGDPKVGAVDVRRCAWCPQIKPHRWDGQGWVVAYHEGCTSELATSLGARDVADELAAEQAFAAAEAAQ